MIKSQTLSPRRLARQGVRVARSAESDEELRRLKASYGGVGQEAMHAIAAVPTEDRLLPII